MSADNGIYILKTEGPEWRVAEICAIDNLSWDEDAQKFCENPDIQIINARRMFKNSPVFITLDEAMRYVAELEQKIEYLEYGISIINVPRKFLKEENKNENSL